jgi:glycosyltransferase involved in cell wall biosynthesis
MSMLRICLVGSEKPYPAFNSLSLILKNILGFEQVMELRIKNWTANAPSILKPLLFQLQDLMLYLKILICYKKHRINTVLIYQAYYPLTCIGLSLSNLKILLYIGGSAFKSSYYKKRSFIGRVMSFYTIPVQEICHKFSHLIIIPSKSMITWLSLEKYANKVRSAICIVDQKFFDRFIKNTNYIERGEIIGYVGSLVRSKGVLNLIRSIYLLKSKHKFRDIYLLIIGDGPLIEDLKVKIKEYGVSENVILKGYVQHHILPYYYNMMKLLVLPSYTEGLPSVILEAMACGTPVLATSVGAVPDIIKDGETGFLLKSNDPEHIARKIIELLNNPELLKKVSENAYNHVRENFSYEKTLESWRRILSELELSIQVKEF